MIFKELSKQILDNQIKLSDLIKFRTVANLNKLELQNINKILDKKDDELKVYI